ncbi:PD-(D/E)XK nuclease family protein [Sulfurisphaera javensis]|uniref:PD-(D/E)XK nuclease family protein n=1 Tax=Sulfurisphaera javensis TaxID=2049879 RepID=A0AAT9GNG6_9CREN
MSLQEEIKKVLKENPSIIVEALMQKPAILYEVLAKLMPWQTLLSEVEKLKSDVEEIKRNMATKEDLKNLVTNEDAKNFVTKDEFKKEINRLETIIVGLGARWGLIGEDAFRRGMYEILKTEGFDVTYEILYDKQEDAYGEPSDVEYDIVIKDHEIIMVEVTSAVKRGDLPTIKKEKEFYEKEKNVKITRVIVVTPFIHDKYPDKVKAIAKTMGIDIIFP